MVGLHHSYRSGFFSVALGLPQARKEEHDARERAASNLQFVGLDALANEEARNLPYGKMRLLEIGRALALDPKLLLDEPAPGPDGARHQGTHRDHPQDQGASH
ncbi:hypothetical protein AXW83_23380 [Bosea sp. PAMC 26642]|nr:hypothetical protein AXW83_23380 [Bosea sp. PAMC 26642]